MIKTIYQFGQQLQKLEDMKGYFEIFGSPYPERATNENIIIATITARQFSGFTLEKYKKEENGFYLFRELAAARSTSIVPTLHFYLPPKASDLESSVEKFSDKLNRCLVANEAIYEPLIDIKNLLENVQSSLTTFVSVHFKDAKNYLFTLKIDGKWIGEITEIKKILEDDAYNKYFSSKGEDFKANDKICAVSYQPATEVWGRVDTLGFTVNDIAFSRNGFNARDSYKMFPVSPEAVKILEGTQRALSDGLSFGFYSMKFFVLPHFVAFDDDVLRGRLVRHFVRKVKRDKTSESSVETQSRSLVQNESIFADIVGEQELKVGGIYYDIFFYEQKQAQFSIKLHVSDVLPSRFKTILEAQEVIENKFEPITKIVTKKQEVFLFKLNFYEIKHYFSEHFFFQIMEAVFHKNEINKHQVLESFMHHIVIAFKNLTNDSYEFPKLVKRSFAIFQYFQILQLFKNKNMENLTSTPLSMTAENFVSDGSFFDSDLKKAAFYLGCVSEIIMQAQRDELNSQPFRHKLNGLNIDYNKLKVIEKEAHNKGEDYREKFKNRADRFFPEIEFEKNLQSFALHFRESSDKDLSKTDISFAFSLGLVMQKEFRIKSIQDANAARATRLAKEKTEKATGTGN